MKNRELKARVFMLYPGALLVDVETGEPVHDNFPIEHPDIEETLGASCVTSVTLAGLVATPLVMFKSVDKYSIRVKQISKITDEDLIKLKNFFNPKGNISVIRSLVCCIDDWQSDDSLDLPIYTTIRLLDGLRSLGYAVRYGRYSVEDLVKEGIFKIAQDG